MTQFSSTVLTGVPAATLQQWLSDAQAAYAGLMTGRRAVTISIGDRSVTYTAAQPMLLVGWIETLQRALGVGRGRRALRPIFR